MPIGGLSQKINSVVKFTEDERMALNLGKCKEMIIDFRKNKSDIPPLEIDGYVFERVKSYKLLGLWIDENLKWKTNVKYLVKKAAKRLFALKVLKKYNAPIEDLKAFYTSVIRSTLEYCAYIWHANLTYQQTREIERIQKRAFRIILPELSYEEALEKCNLKTLEDRRVDMCINLITTLRDPGHKLHGLLPPKVGEIRTRETRLSEQKFYNFNCRTERFKNSAIVYGIEQFNSISSNF